MLAVRDEYELWKWSQRLSPVSCFREPDLDGALTAIAAGDPSAGQLLRKLPLALSHGEGVRQQHE
jgi:hypothetical protein